MKVLRFLATLALVLAGMALLWAPAHAQMNEAAKAFTPTRFTVVDEGAASRPDVVLIPGLSSSREVWKAEAAKLAPNYRLHLVQINGFAGQPAGPNASGAILEPIVTELHAYIASRAMHPVVIGHSLGGLLTLMLAERYPTDVRKMVVVDALPFYAVLFAPDATAAGAKPIAEGMKAQIMAVPAERYAAMQPMMAAQLVNDPEGRERVVASSMASDRAVVAEAMAEDLTTDARAGLNAIKAPVFVMYEHDTTMQQPNADAYEKTMKDSYALLPGVHLVGFDGSRHFIMYDQPAKFDTVLEAFLK
ncbi:MAG TPA: alpha/beta hydrolase [Acidobacteriaceae bacterium]